MKTEKLKNLSKILITLGFESYSASVQELLKFSADPIATNRAVSEEIPEGWFDPSDVNPELYKEKLVNLFKRDVFVANFERYKEFYLKKGMSESEAIAAAEKKIDEISRTRADKSVSSHSSATSVLKDIGAEKGDLIVSPGSGFGHEQIIAPEYKWRGLEYQKNLVDMANQRNVQMGLSDSSSREWSLSSISPDQKFGEDWKDKLHSIVDKDGVPKIVYAKHACGGLTDGVMFDASNKGVKKMLFATCCAHRYPDLSWRILEPRDKDGRPMSFEEYEKIAHSSKKQGAEGEAAVNMIDGWREEFLKNRGYKVKRGVKDFGPYIVAEKL
jgi:hypothetical protein